jgi:membrane protease YdiL (CAAX protease family)
MTPDQPQGLADLQSYLWLVVAVAVCLPVCIIVLRRIGRWWLSAQGVPPPLGGPQTPVPWPAALGMLVFLGLLLLTMGLPTAYDGAARAGLLPWEPLKIPEMFSPGMFLGQVLPPLVGLLFVAKFGRAGLEAVGIRRESPRSGVLHGLVAFLTILPVCVVGLVASMKVMAFLKAPVTTHPLLEMVQETHEAWVIPVAIFQAGVLAPVAEEFMYRGVLMMTLLKQMGILGALIVSSALFAIMHLTTEPQAVLPLFFLGIALGYVAYRTRSLVAPIVTHAIFNTLMVLGTSLGGK